MEFVGSFFISLVFLFSLLYIRVKCFFILVVFFGMCRGWGFSVWFFDDLVRVVFSRCVIVVLIDFC